VPQHGRVIRRHSIRTSTLIYRTGSSDLVVSPGSNRHLSVKVLETDRLILRRLSVEDAEFILRLLNEPSFVRFIGDKGVRSIEDARDYISRGPVESYERFGFGLYLTELKESGAPIGICGLLKREALEDVDVGFAFLPQFWRKGYAFESASAVMTHGRKVVGLKRIVAITSPDNDASIKVLEKLGLRFERMTKLSDDEPEVKLFALEGTADSVVEMTGNRESL
jgi:RimJ/RimL family protein N-acetyltransferase